MSLNSESALKNDRPEVPRQVVSAISDHIPAGEVVKTSTVGQVTVKDPVMTAREVNVYYGAKHAIHDVSIDVAKNSVIAFIGPSGCGKSTFLRCLNRMNDTIDGARVAGAITLDGHDIYDRDQDVVQLRARAGFRADIQAEDRRHLRRGRQPVGEEPVQRLRQPRAGVRRLRPGAPHRREARPRGQ